MDLLLLLADSAGDLTIYQLQVDKLYSLINTMMWAIGTAICGICATVVALCRWCGVLLFSQEESKDGRSRGIVIRYHSEGITAINNVSDNVKSLMATVQTVSPTYAASVVAIQSEIAEVRRQLDKVVDATDQTVEIRRQLDTIEAITRSLSPGEKSCLKPA